MTETLLTACEAVDQELEGSFKTDDDVTRLKLLADKYGSIDYARDVASRFAETAAKRFEELRMTELRSGPDTDFLGSIVQYVVGRRR